MPQVVAKTELDTLIEILANNQDKNFVQRILRPNDYPTLEGEGEFKGKIHTHLMSDTEADGRFIAYPEVVMQDGKLIKKERDEAFNYAMKTGEYIEFPTDTVASWFAKNYKKYWKKMGYKN